MQVRARIVEAKDLSAISSFSLYQVGPGRYCLPRHSPCTRPSFMQEEEEQEQEEDEAEEGEEEEAAATEKEEQHAKEGVGGG